MKKITLFALMAISMNVSAGKAVENATVGYVYQLDSATDFDFYSPVANGCGSTLYRVRSPNETVANRKFSLVLTAFTAGKRITFHDTETCEGDRSVVAWVRLVN